MSCARLVAAVLTCATGAFAAGINTDAALTVGEGQWVARTRLRYQDVEGVVDRFLAQQTILYGVTSRLSAFATVGHVWNEPGEDGLTDLLVRGRYEIFARDEKRATLTISALFGVETPIGEEPIGSPDGGVRAGVVGTWERSGWRVDADFENAWRPNASDFRRADLALIRNIAETEGALWQGVVELNYSRTGRADVLFLAPGVVYEISGWKLEASLQIQVAEDAALPVSDFTVVFGVVHVF